MLPTPGSQVVRTTPELCVCGKKTASRGETSQLRQAGNSACATDKLPLSRHLHPWPCSIRTCTKGQLLLVRCHRCLLGGLFRHATRSGGSRKQEIQCFYMSPLPTQLCSLNAGILPNSHTTVKVVGRAENRKVEEEGRETQDKVRPCWQLRSHESSAKTSFTSQMAVSHWWSGGEQRWEWDIRREGQAAERAKNVVTTCGYKTKQ